MGLLGGFARNLFGGWFQARAKRNVERKHGQGKKLTKAENAILKEPDVTILDMIPGREFMKGKKTNLGGIVGMLVGLSVIFGFAPPEVTEVVSKEAALGMAYGGYLAMTFRAARKNGK